MELAHFAFDHVKFVAYIIRFCLYDIWFNPDCWDEDNAFGRNFRLRVWLCCCVGLCIPFTFVRYPAFIVWTAFLPEVLLHLLTAHVLFFCCGGDH